MEVLSLRRCSLDTEVKRTLAERVVGVTIGNFDGFHLGHQALFERLTSVVGARSSDSYRILLTFAPHPRRKLSGLSAAELRADPSFWHITGPRRKIVLADRYGFDAVLFLRFSRALRETTPADFVDSILKKTLHAAVVVVGDDWRFGKGREGNASALAELNAERGIHTEIVQAVTVDGQRVSSSLIRTLLRSGDLEKLGRYLGRRFGVDGIVIHGEKRGRELGYPTANIQFRDQLLPPDGVYAVRVLVDGAWHAAAASLGPRPMFANSGDKLLEVHILDLPWKELYGQRLEVEFVQFLRRQERYPDIATLCQQMKQDTLRARQAIRDMEC